jgi:hypothetical protein
MDIMGILDYKSKGNGRDPAENVWKTLERKAPPVWMRAFRHLKINLYLLYISIYNISTEYISITPLTSVRGENLGR